MPINPNIILGIQQPQFRVADPLESAGKALTLQNLMGQQDMQGMQMRQARLAEADDLATREAFRAGGDQKAIIDRLMGAGQYRPAQALQKSMLESDKLRGDIGKVTAETGKIGAETVAKTLDMYKTALPSLSGPQDGVAWLTAQYNDPVLGPVMQRMAPLEQAIARVPQDPQGFRDWQFKSSAGIDKFMSDQRQAEQQAETGRRNLRTEALTAEQQAEIARNNLVNNRISQGQLGVAQGNLGVARSRLDIDRNAQLQGRIPPGYRIAPDGQSLEAIPGGPAGTGKALPSPAVTSLAAAGTAVEDTKRLAGTFESRFGGKTILGELSNTFGRIAGDKTGQSQWWQDMDALQNQTRNALFGSALTKTELAAWEKTSVTPRMNADQIKENLARRAEIEARAASKLARAYEAGGYNKDQIRELLGTGAEYLDKAAPPTGANRPRQLVPGATRAGPVTQPGGVRFLGFE